MEIPVPGAIAIYRPAIFQFLNESANSLKKTSAPQQLFKKMR